MKHRIIGFLAFMLFLLLGFTCCAEEMIIPDDIANYFQSKNWEKYEVIRQEDVTGQRASDCRFVLIRINDTKNTLYCFKIQKNKWVHSFHTTSAIPQGDNKVDIYLTPELVMWETGSHATGPILVIDQLDQEDEYAEFFSAYQLSGSGVWNLVTVWSRGKYEKYEKMICKERSITYYENIESDRISGTVYGNYQRDLRYIRLSGIPRNLKEAQNKLTQPPSVPQSDELAPHDFHFSGGGLYDVYSAPSESAVRGANGKAKASTNDWIQVFGKENDWILIQYAIDADHCRFGYISGKALPEDADVPDLDFDPMNAWTKNAVVLTDDPLYSQSALLPLMQGMPVAWLATLGGWAYVEVDGGDLARGFIPLAAVTTDRIFDMGNNPGEDGQVVYTGAVTVTADGRIEAALTPKAAGPLAGKRISTIQLSDTFSGDLLALLSADPSGIFCGDGVLDGDVTSVTLTALDAEGNACPPIVRLEW